MSRYLYYLTHPQVKIDPEIPVPNWGLSDLGRQRASVFAHLPFLKAVTAIVSSAENKALETATTISAVISVGVEIRHETHENDRSSTGFLIPDEFERVADAFFAAPYESVRGWETAIDAQSRIVDATQKVIASHPSGNILMVGHGGVGTLLYCYLAGVPISRAYDQPGAGGSLFAFDITDRQVVHSWKSIEDLKG